MAYKSHYRGVIDGWTYFIEAPGHNLVKIGAAKNVWPRFQSIQSCSPVELKLIGVALGRGIEYQLHQQFADWRVRGEWFRMDAPGMAEALEAYRLNPRTEAIIHGKALV